MSVAVLYPVLAQIVLTLVLVFIMGVSRRTAVRNKDVTIGEIALDASRWPTQTRQYANCYSNQFELPVLFYVLCLMAQMTRTADIFFVVLAWVFVVCRVIHAYIHTTSNFVPRRGAIFTVGYFVVALMTALLFLRLLFPSLV